MKHKFAGCLILLMTVTFSYAQCTLSVKEYGDTFYILKDCGQGATYLDEVHSFYLFRHPKWLLGNDGALYHTWIARTMAGDRAAIQKISLKKSGKLDFHPPIGFHPKYFSKELKEENCLKLAEDGVYILFKNESISPYFVPYHKLDDEEALLAEIMKAQGIKLEKEE